MPFFGWLKGRKTYIVAVGMLMYEVVGHLIGVKELNVQTMLEAIALITLRAGVSKTINSK